MLGLKLNHVSKRGPRTLPDLMLANCELHSQEQTSVKNQFKQKDYLPRESISLFCQQILGHFVEASLFQFITCNWSHMLINWLASNCDFTENVHDLMAKVIIRNWSLTNYYASAREQWVEIYNFITPVHPYLTTSIPTDAVRATGTQPSRNPSPLWHQTWCHHCYVPRPCTYI